MGETRRLSCMPQARSQDLLWGGGGGGGGGVGVSQEPGPNLLMLE